MKANVSYLHDSLHHCRPFRSSSSKNRPPGSSVRLEGLTPEAAGLSGGPGIRVMRCHTMSQFDSCRGQRSEMKLGHAADHVRSRGRPADLDFWLDLELDGYRGFSFCDSTLELMVHRDHKMGFVKNPETGGHV